MAPIASSQPWFNGAKGAYMYKLFIGRRTGFIKDGADLKLVVRLILQRGRSGQGFQPW